MIEVYTDASVARGAAMVTCFIITSDQFIGANTTKYTNIGSSLQAEFLGIRDGIRYVSDRKKSDDIVVYCDSQSAIDLIQRRDDTGVDVPFANVVDEILTLCSGRNVSFILIKGHQLSHNPNKVVDLMSNSLLRFEKGRC